MVAYVVGREVKGLRPHEHPAQEVEALGVLIICPTVRIVNNYSQIRSVLGLLECLGANLS